MDACSEAQWREWIDNGAERLGINLDSHKIGQLTDFAKELLEAARTVNLTRVDDPLEIAEILLLDSMVPGKFIPAGANVLDLGTGAGIPGIPLKIAFPDLNMTLIDGRRKRINFVRYMIRRLGLANIGAHHVRAEEMAWGSERFDAVVSRAVSSVKELHRLSAPLVQKRGLLIAMKGRGVASELDADDPGADRQQGGTRLRLETYRLPRLGIERVLAILEYGI